MDDIKRPLTKGKAQSELLRSRLYNAGRRSLTSVAPVDVAAVRRPVEGQAQALPAVRHHTFTFNVPFRSRKVAGHLFGAWRRMPLRIAFVAAAVILVAYELIPIIQPQMGKQAYALGDGGQFLPAASDSLGQKLHHDTKEQGYVFNAGYTASSRDMGMGGPRIGATAYEDPTKGVKVTDPVNNVDFGIKPKFRLFQPRQEKNRVVYPLGSGDGWLVYSMQTAQVKEDILLERAHSDKMTFPYELSLPDGSEARMQKNGSIGIYGSSLPLNGMVSTGSDKDAELLRKARKKAPKDKLLFIIPAPTIIENNRDESVVKASYSIKNNELELVVKNLQKANYPLSIDPSVYVETAAKFLRANNDSNIDFDAANELIEKGVLTGGRINSWSNTSMTNLQNGRWSQGVAAAGGFVYSVGGRDATANQSDVQWSKLDTNTYTTTPPTPGATGACTNWCVSSVSDYNLPAPRSGLSVVIYNGYLYAIGGKDASCAGGGVCNTVYVAKLGVNGEPQLWRPTTVAGMAYWHATSTLGTERVYGSAIAYNGRIYMSGGQSNAGTGGVATIEVADINPNGTLGTWTASTSMAAALWGHTLLQYNGYLYVAGGFSHNFVDYIKINSDGTLPSSIYWVAGSNALAATHIAYGGAIATISGGYVYVTGGCASFNVSTSFCTLVSDTMQIASINGDGSLTDWTSLTGVTITRTGFGMVGWRNTLYLIGGCGATITGGNCTTPLTTAMYGTVNLAGDVSPNELQTGMTFSATNSDNSVGRYGGGAVINDGYIYVIGGCLTTNGCNATTEMNDNIGYAPIAVDGSISGWAYANNVLNAAVGAAGFTTVLFNNYIYVIGGYVGTATWSSTIYKSTINTSTHVPGTFAAETGTLLTGTGWGGATVRTISSTSAYLYIVGGCNSGGVALFASACAANYQDTVLRCPLTITTGAVAACTTNSNAWTLPDIERSTVDAPGSGQGIGAFGFGVWGDYVYIVGGLCGSSGSGSGSQLDNGCDSKTTGSGNVNMTNSRHVYYSKFDSSGTLVKPSGCTAQADTNVDLTVWCLSPVKLNSARRLNSALAVNGYLYAASGQQNTASQVPLTTIETVKLNPDDGSLYDDGVTHEFTLLTSPGSNISGGWGQAFVANAGYLYLTFGCTAGAAATSCSTVGTGIDKLQVYNNYSGSPGAYSTITMTGVADRLGAATAVYNGYIYVAGGCTAGASDCTAATYLNTNYYAPINPNGTIGTWVAGSTTNFTARAFGCLTAVGGYLYYLGGQTAPTGGGNALSDVLSSQITAGAPGAWSTGNAGIGDTNLQAAQVRYNPGCATWNNRIYVTGGMNATPAQQDSVYISPSLASGGTMAADSWTSSTVLPSGRSGHILVAYGNTLFALGGFDGTNYLMDTQFAPISSTGTVGAWSTGTPLPQPVRQGTGFAANGYLYVLGGRSAATACTTDTYTAPIQGYNVLGSTRNGIGTWSQTNVNFSGARYGAGGVYSGGRAYMIGGACNGTLMTSTNVGQQSSLWSQPQQATYSMMIDADTDITPTYWLFNGVDNGIGAKWQLQYKSASDANSTCDTPMTAWGQTTTVSAIELKRLGTYTPKDGSGTTLKCSRYHYMLLTVDASQAFGFAEDTSRGPNIADMSLYFTSDPGKRLMHGRTFTGGQQQPMDTPPDATGAQ